MSLDKNLEINHIPARVGDNVEIKCDVTGTPPPPLVWRRYDADLEALSEPEVRHKNKVSFVIVGTQCFFFSYFKEILLCMRELRRYKNVCCLKTE